MSQIDQQIQRINPGHVQGHKLRADRYYVWCEDCPDPTPQLSFEYEYNIEFGLCDCSAHKCPRDSIVGTRYCAQCQDEACQIPSMREE